MYFKERPFEAVFVFLWMLIVGSLRMVLTFTRKHDTIIKIILIYAVLLSIFMWFALMRAGK